jgi:cysteine-rich repeat protein
MGGRFGFATLVVGALAWTGSGCLDVPGMTCEDGRICPSGMVCAPGGCALPQQLEACAGQEPGAPCSYAGVQGTCIDGLCVSSGCGNGILDEGEACDDGRRCADGTPCEGACTDGSGCQPRGGYGCSRDCSKIEVCGDGFVDEGEACDDGNANPADGCDQCALAQWVAQAVVGGGISGTSVGLNAPNGAAVDPSGNLFIADTANHRIRRVEAATGTITTVAGTGVAGFSGDGGAATSADLRNPMDVAVDGLGNLYLADGSNNRVRRVDAATGTITTVAGTGTAGFSGDGGPATEAELRPSGVAVDGLGNLFIAEANNHRIRRVDAATGVIVTVAGTGVSGFTGDNFPATMARLDSPRGVTIDGLGNFFIADAFNNRIRRVDGSSGVITTVAGSGPAGSGTGAFSGDGGPATAAQLNGPSGVVVDSFGSIFVGDQGNHRVRRVGADGVIHTVAGTGTRGFSGDGGSATSAQLDSPRGLALDGSNDLFIADSQNHRVRRVDAATGAIVTAVGSGPAGGGSSRFSGDGAAATSARLDDPDAVAVDGLGSIIIAGRGANRIHHVDATTNLITTLAGSGTGGFAGDGGPATSAQLARPTGVAVDGSGNLFITDQFNARVRRVDAQTGVISTVAGAGTPGFSGDDGAATSAEFSIPRGVALDGEGHLFIADSQNHRVRRVDAATGIITTVAGSGPTGFLGGGFAGDGDLATSALLRFPSDVALDSLGNLFIADTSNHRIRRVDAGTGVITTVAGSGVPEYSGDGVPATSAGLHSPTGIAVDGLGSLFIADTGNYRIRRMDAATGIITTVVGTGTHGFSGDGGPATSAELKRPVDVAIDALGNLIIADSEDNRIRRLDAETGVITTVAGAIDPEGMGPLLQAQLSDPRAVVLAPALALLAGGASGTVQAIRDAVDWLGVVAGRYPHPQPIADLARFRDSSFGTVVGVAYDASLGLIYLTEASANSIHVVTIVDPDDKHTWTIAPLANEEGTAGFANGPAATARFRNPTGLFLDEAAQTLYVTDTGNHVLRAIDVSNGPAASTVSTIAGTPETLGFFGDYGPATGALLFQPQAVTRCDNGDIFLADTGNHRVRRIEPDGTITTVLGDGTAASSGQGTPAITFPVNAPLGLACDPFGNLLVTSTNTVRLVAANDAGIIDGTGLALTIYGAPPRDTFPASVTRCLTGLAVASDTTVQVTDSCTGMLIALTREAVP